MLFKLTNLEVHKTYSIKSLIFIRLNYPSTKSFQKPGAQPGFC